MNILKILNTPKQKKKYNFVNVLTWESKTSCEWKVKFALKIRMGHRHNQFFSIPSLYIYLAIPICIIFRSPKPAQNFVENDISFYFAVNFSFISELHLFPFIVYFHWTTTTKILTRASDISSSFPRSVDVDSFKLFASPNWGCPQNKMFCIF